MEITTDFKPEKPIKSGLIIEPIAPEDWLFGAKGIDLEEKVSDGSWTPYLPSNEKQREGYESMGCTNWASLNCLEILFTWKIKSKLISVGNLQWLSDNGYFDENGNINFSDNFDFLVANTDINSGNTLKAPAEAKRKYGLIPQKMMPMPTTEAEFIDKSRITPQMYALGQEFLKRFPINYEFVYRADFVNALKISPLAGACHAWDGTSMGVYIRVTDSINHAITIIDPPTIWKAYDSYDPFLKNLADNYLFLDYAIRYIIGENTDMPDSSIKKNMYSLYRDPQNQNEVYAFTENKIGRAHV